MAKVIGVMGESGAGKTTAMRNLPPKETFYFDCDGKGMNWKGWKSQYSESQKNCDVFWRQAFSLVGFGTEWMGDY